MKRFEILLPEIKNIYSSIQDPINRNLCSSHHLLVLSEIQKLSENECLYIAALLHDISLYLGIRGSHALKSSEYARVFLKKYDLFSNDEIDLICKVIALHSDKKNIHFEEAQLLKKADIKAHELEL